MKRILLPAALIAFAALDCRGEQPPIERILGLKGNTLWEAAESLGDANFSARDLIRIVQKLIAEPYEKPPGGLNSFGLSNCFEAACNKASAAELSQLIQIYVNFDHESFEKQFEFQPLAARWIQEELKTGHFRPRKNLVSEETSAPVPGELENREPELVKAWKAYKAIIQPVEQTIYINSSKRSKISFQANQRAFFKLLDDALLKRGKGLAERLIEFGWSGMSGTGSELVNEPRSVAIFMALLSEGRIPEALGAALYVRGDKALITGDTDVRIEFLRVCGGDWEIVFAGAEIEAERFGPWGTYGDPVLKELAGFGSDHAATLVGMMARQAKPDLRVAYANAISAFMTEGSLAQLRFSNGAYDRISKRPISPRVKLALAKVLQDFAEPGVSPDLAKAVLDGFARAQLPETKLTLYQLAKHRSAQVAEEAIYVLQAMGEKISAPVAAATSPARFRILVNGKPMAPHSQIWWELDGFSSTSEVGEDGMIGIDFLEEAGKPTKVSLSSGERNSAEGPSFHVELPVPSNLDSVTEVNVEVSSFPLIIRAPAGTTSPRDSKASVLIKQRLPENLKDTNQTEDLFTSSIKRQFEITFDQPVNLSLQVGHYDVTVTATGAARLTKQITVPSQTSSLEIQLTAGSDLHYELIRPDGERRAPVELRKAGQHVAEDYYDREKRTFRWLPPGSYVLHIAASKALESEDREFLGYGPANIPWSECDIPFEITPESPGVINLGEIALEQAGD